MFVSQKENSPLSGGWSLAIKRIVWRYKTLLAVVLIFALFVGTVSVLSNPVDSTSDKVSSTTKSEYNPQEEVERERNVPKKTPIEAKDSKQSEDLRRQAESLFQREQDLLKKEGILEEERKKLLEQQKLLEQREQLLEKKENAIKSDKGEIKLSKDIKKELNELKKETEKIQEVVKIQKSSSLVGNADVTKQNAVKEAFQFAWSGYVSRAWGQDELHPVDGTSSNWIGLGLTILDSLDTLHIMGLNSDFKKARDWVDQHFDPMKARPDISVFETTIRVIGGLLSAFELSRDKMFLEKADFLANKFLPAFNTQSGIPMCTINVQSGRATNPGWTGGSSILSEVGTIQLEFFYLYKHTNKTIYKEKALHVYDVLDSMTKPNDGLYPVYVNPNGPSFPRQHITLGALGDSFYEYLLKLWIMTGEKGTKYRNMYEESASAVIKHLLKKSSPNSLTYIAELINGNINPKMDHLVCFAGAMFALGARGSNKEEHLKIGEEITKTCYQFYARTATGISPELVHFGGNNDFTVPSDAKHYLLRPETVESFFVLWRMTHDPIYREMGWEVFQSINKYCKAQYGYSGIRDVTTTQVTHDNLQQSFFLAETLKYLYLLF